MRVSFLPMLTGFLLPKRHLILFWSFSYQEVEKYKLGNPRTFHYLNQSNCYELDGVDSSKEYLLTKRAMDVVGISQGEQVMHFVWYLVGIMSPFFFLYNLCHVRMEYSELWLQFFI